MPAMHADCAGTFKWRVTIITTDTVRVFAVTVLAAQGCQAGFFIFWKRGREKLLEICADTVSAAHKVHLFYIRKALSSGNKCTSHFDKPTVQASSGI